MNMIQWNPFKYPQHQNKAQTTLLSGFILERVISYYFALPLTSTPAQRTITTESEVVLTENPERKSNLFMITIQ